jgi:hypothetical protein
MRHQFFDGLVGTARKQFRHGAMAGYRQPWRQFGQRRKHEGPLMHARMGQAQHGVGTALVAIKQQIEVEVRGALRTLRWRPKRASMANSMSSKVGAGTTAFSSTTALMKSG